jgi:HK97 gp10 family phage protein
MSFDYDGALKRVQKKWIAKAAKVIEDEAARRAPVDTGRLRGSITGKTISDDEAEVGANVGYAPYVEYGTKFQAAQPYMRPAVDTHKKQLTQDFRKMLDDEHRKEARRGKR